METRPSRMRRSPPRREVSPACARILLSLSFAKCATDDRALGRKLWHDELTFDLWQVGEITQPERDQKLARRLVEVRTPRGFLAPRDANEAPLEQAFQHAFGIHAADRVHLGTRDRLLVADDRQCFERGSRQ